MILLIQNFSDRKMMIEKNPERKSEKQLNKINFWKIKAQN